MEGKPIPVFAQHEVSKDEWWIYLATPDKIPYDSPPNDMPHMLAAFTRSSGIRIGPIPHDIVDSILYRIGVWESRLVPDCPEPRAMAGALTPDQKLQG